MSDHSTAAPGPTKPEEEVHRIDVGERGGKGADGEPQASNSRLFVQVLVFDCPAGTRPEGVAQTLAGELKQRGAMPFGIRAVGDLGAARMRHRHP